ncbi:MAG: NUDIX domain-containing protein [Planctomycetaceae bacterium]|nr:NUDIX domain-containing protein [Planctomycetaceae bacterium]
MAAQEIFDVCDADDNVIGQATRADVHANGLLHRAVHMWVFRSDGRMLLHFRSSTKDEYPHCYTSSASGHVDAGESYDTAAVRELREELGLEASLEYLIKLPAGPDTANEHTVLYRCETDATPTPDPGEIERIEWRTIDEIATMIDANPEQFTPPFRSLFEWYRETTV